MEIENKEYVRKEGRSQKEKEKKRINLKGVTEQKEIRYGEKEERGECEINLEGGIGKRGRGERM